MKTFILVRHAKPHAQAATQKDFDRTLNERGERDARLMGQRLARANIHPDLIVSSPAKRALATARIIAAAIGYAAADIVLNAKIYEAKLSDLLGVINGFDDRAPSVMLIGHNPGASELAIDLTVAPIEDMPTCAVAQIALRVDVWADVRQGSGKLIEFDYPKKEI